MSADRVAVIGNGPAGVLAAWAAVLNGAEVTVFHLGQRSKIHGAQYIHADIPGTEELPPFKIKYERRGTEDGYRHKVYGSQPVTTSWGQFGSVAHALSMRDVYDLMYANMEANCHQVEGIVDQRKLWTLTATYRYVLNTAPLPSLKPDGQYESQEVWITPFGMKGLEDNTIVYVGDESHPAYRVSSINGYVSSEYPSRDAVPALHRRHAFRILKPLRCRVELPHVHRLGRYGKWHKGVLAHEAFVEAGLIIREGRPWTMSLPN